MMNLLLRFLRSIDRATRLSAYATTAAFLLSIPAQSEDLILSAEAQFDFDLMREALEEAHPGLYRHSDKSIIDLGFSQQRSKLSQPMAKRKFYGIMSETLGLIKCGHTSINPDREMGRAFANARLFPLQVILKEGHVMVLSNETPEDTTIIPGMEILEINGNTTPELIDQFLRVTSADGHIQSSKRVQIQRGFAMYYWILIDQSNHFQIKAKHPDGKVIVANLPGVSRDQFGQSNNPVNDAILAGKAKMDWPGDNLSIRFVHHNDIAQIRIRSFSDDKFSNWMEETFRMLREKKTKTLIIDLRGNRGGADMNGATLVSYLSPKPFRYFEHIEAVTIDPSFKAHTDWPAEQTRNLRNSEVIPVGEKRFLVKHLGTKMQHPGVFPFLGKVYVLVDGGTFSTAADACAVIQHLKLATFVGEETGGGYYGNNSGLTTRLTLPKSQFQVKIPMYAYWNSVSNSGQKNRGTIPDYQVANEMTDWMRGVDTQLSFAMQLATNGQGD